MYDELVKQLRASADWADRLALLMGREEGDTHAPIMRQAADAIEELLPYMRQVEKGMGLLDKADELLNAVKPRWIPVTERLPKEGKFVLVYGDLYPNKHDGGVIAVSKRMDWNYWQGFGRERDITHWMLLPEPPKEET